MPHTSPSDRKAVAATVTTASSARNAADDDGNVPGIDCSDVTKTFFPRSGEEPVAALDGINLRIPQGEFTTIVGPSGCGKSTLLKAVAGLVKPTTGRVTVRGRVVEGPHTDVGLMFQDALLMPWRTALEHALLPTQIAGRVRVSDEQRAREMLDRVGLAGFANAYPHELSGGMQQRVALARTLMSEPDVLLLDEPFGSLDELNRERMHLQLLELWEATRKTILFITHSVQEAVFLSTSIIVMDSKPGRIVSRIEVPLPRPRSVSVLRHPDYMETVFAVREAMGVQR
jgi:NitT/TauT family transport system ATP-binding protein